MPAERPKVYSASDLAHMSGLGRTYVYHLVQTGILPPIEPRRATRIRFDESAVQLARVFADLQKRRGVTPHGLVKLIREAVDTSISQQLEPLRSKMTQLTHQIIGILRNAVEARRGRSPHSAGSPPVDEIAQAEGNWRDYLAHVAEQAMDVAERYRDAEEAYGKARKNLLNVPPDDRVWTILDPLFEGARQREDFIMLLSGTGVLGRLIASSAQAILHDGYRSQATLDAGGQRW